MNKYPCLIRTCKHFRDPYETEKALHMHLVGHARKGMLTAKVVTREDDPYRSKLVFERLPYMGKA